MAEQVSFPDMQSVAPRATTDTAARPERNPNAPAASPQEAVLPDRTQQVGPAAEAEQQQPLHEDLLSERQRDALKDAFRDLNGIMHHFAKSVRFAIFEQSGELYAQVINTRTNEVVKTIPSEEALEMMNRVHEVIGMLLDARG